jgi:hypothetical protein
MGLTQTKRWQLQRAYFFQAAMATPMAAGNANSRRP